MFFFYPVAARSRQLFLTCSTDVHGRKQTNCYFAYQMR
jgi:hypothetical protein